MTTPLNQVAPVNEPVMFNLSIDGPWLASLSSSVIQKQGSVITGINKLGFVVGIPSIIEQEMQVSESDFIVDGEIIGEEYHAFDLLSDEAGVVIQNLIPRLPLDPRDISRTLGLKAERNKFILLSRNSIQEQWTEVEVAGVRITGIPTTIYLNRDFMLKALKFGFNELQHACNNARAHTFCKGAVDVDVEKSKDLYLPRCCRIKMPPREN